MPQEPVKGSCLCGSVSFDFKPPFSAFRYCHCSRCRKATGSAHASNVFVAASQFAWSAGETLVNHFKLPGAKTFAVSFCTRCGSRVPHLIAERNEYLVPAGLLDNDPVARPENAIFWGSKAPWHVETQTIPRFDERP
ncbi:MAG TPA: GFA family protein [Burkholderiales bacterium]|nr:GFA family protein [Burkholderiales bacterium]